MHLVVTVVVFVVLAFSLARTTSVYFVKPTPHAKCPGHPCFTLSEYAQNSSQFFTSNASFDFLPGVYTLDRNITVTNISRLSLNGKHNSTLQVSSWIICAQRVHFTFRHAQEIRITSIGVMSCGIGTLGSAFSFLFVNDFSIELCSFKQNQPAPVLSSHSTGTLKNVSFTNGTAIYGGAVSSFKSSLKFSGAILFSGNQADIRGGALYGQDSLIKFQDSVEFLNNAAYVLGGAIATLNTTLHFDDQTAFVNNSAFVGGAIIAATDSHVYSSGNIAFVRNSARTGGALYVIESSVVEFIGASLFFGNAALGDADVVVRVGQSVMWDGTTGLGRAGAGGGGAISAVFGTVSIAGQSNFSANTAPNGGAVYSVNSLVSFNGTAQLFNNTCKGSGGAVYVIGSSAVSFSGFFHFRENIASEGGAISTEQASFLNFQSPVELTFTSNRAVYGGAMFVLDRLTLNYCTRSNQIQYHYSFCFFRIFLSLTDKDTDIRLQLVDNTAEAAGSVLYGGSLHICSIIFPNSPGALSQDPSAIAYLQSISNITNPNMTSVISSDPVRICFCLNGTYDCDYDLPPFYRNPGQSLNLSLAAIDQANNSIPATIRASFSVESHAELGIAERTQPIHPFCTLLKYTVLSSRESETLTLAAQSECNDLGTALQSITVFLTRCPDGFELVKDQCLCEQRLQELSTTCDVDTNSIERTGDFWVEGYYSSNGTYNGLIVHRHCPFDYCKAGPVNFTLSASNAQCASGRTGVLCGDCSPGLSLTLGSLQCEECSNAYLALLVVFAVLGVALVLLISLCRLTVGVGTMNGLIFYANIVGVDVNKAIFFPAGDSNLLTVFIAWVNLDFGIQSCFYDGLDAYTQTWLQFTFPLYLWLLVILLIVASKYSITVTQLLGRNPVAVLATLFLLSYAKLLRTIITALYFTYLEYPDGSKEFVWLIDGNFRYLHGKHIPLVIFALMVLFILFLPYTLLLLLGQWLQTKTGFKVLSWMNSLWVKHFLDAYYGPFKSQHRYWTGLLLLMRCALLFVFAFDVLGDGSLNLLVIASSVVGITSLTRLTKGIYTRWILDVLETSYFVNLGILAAGTFHLRQSGGSQAALTYLSVGIAFATFIATAVVQTYKQLKETRFGKKIADFTALLPCRRQQYCKINAVANNQSGGPPVGDDSIQARTAPNVYIRLRESLLETNSW